MKKSNDVLRKEVIEAIKWEPILHSNEIDVSVDDGIVTLGGAVDNYTQKKEAELVMLSFSTGYISLHHLCRCKLRNAS